MCQVIENVLIIGEAVRGLNIDAVFGTFKAAGCHMGLDKLLWTFRV